MGDGILGASYSVRGTQFTFDGLDYFYIYMILIIFEEDENRNFVVRIIRLNERASYRINT